MTHRHSGESGVGSHCAARRASHPEQTHRKTQNSKHKSQSEKVLGAWLGVGRRARGRGGRILRMPDSASRNFVDARFRFRFDVSTVITRTSVGKIPMIIINFHKAQFSILSDYGLRADRSGAPELEPEPEHRTDPPRQPWLDPSCNMAMPWTPWACAQTANKRLNRTLYCHELERRVLASTSV